MRAELNDVNVTLDRAQQREVLAQRRHGTRATEEKAFGLERLEVISGVGASAIVLERLEFGFGEICAVVTAGEDE